MNKNKNSIIDEAFDGRPTRFGKAVVKAARRDHDQNDLDNMGRIFLKTSFWLQVAHKKGSKKGTDALVSVSKNGKQSFIIFEKKARAIEWFKNKEKLHEVRLAMYESGYDLLKALPLPMIKQSDIYIDFGKKTFIVFSPEQTLHLRKIAV